MAMTEFEQHVLNDYQHDFPLVPEPFQKIAADLGAAEAEVIGTLERLRQQGAVSRVGAVFRPHTIGASTLVALAAPPDKLAAVAQQVSARPEVNHNYEREHRYNLWFVVTAPDSAQLEAALRSIEQETGYPLLVLPMIEDFHIDLGFDLRQKVSGVAGSARGAHRCKAKPAPATPDYRPHPAESALINAIQDGIPLVSRPWAVLGARAGMSEPEVMDTLAQLQAQGIIRRLGVVVRHHELGYRANAMVVWDIPDETVSAAGRCLGQFDCVTLCYRRPRRQPEWRYNLFTMIHGRDRDEVLGLVEQLRAACQLQHVPHEVLFSCRRFKQCGARYSEPVAVPA
jgi:DNA-binding Lrp family transcriptional regulator